MKAIILCAGMAKRLYPLTVTMPKHLIPVANKPILFYGLEAIRDVGVTEVGIVVGATRKDIEAAVGNGDKWGLRITYIPQENPQGLAHAVKISRNFLQEEPFIMYLGDNLLKEGLNSFADNFNKNKPNALILLYEVSNPSQFGIAIVENGQVKKVMEKPKNPPTNLALVGAYIFDHTIYEAIDAIKPSARGELEITDAIEYLIENGFVVEPHHVSGWWKDTGRPEDIIEANRFILDGIKTDIHGQIKGKSQIVGRVAIETGTEIIDSIVRGPVAIGKNCKIINSFVGPYTSIGDGVVLENSEIEHSVMMGNSSIRNIDGRIDNSLLGRNVKVNKIEAKPHVYKLIHGDNSSTELP
ncbi:MAG: glucose-1-phosphate thymidylyltransferase [Nitrospinae bacterium]|nr:glucose-1-phosphate thymidylyltransferase [Nitrospinota bacterium]